jgi:hexokinase
MGVAAVLTHMGPDGVDAHVGIDGSVFKKHARFKGVRHSASPAAGAAHIQYYSYHPSPPLQWMEEALLELGVACTLVMAEDGSGFGAAIVAKVAEAIKTKA